jgi:hypothetical protein
MYGRGLNYGEPKLETKKKKDDDAETHGNMGYW